MPCHQPNMDRSKRCKILHFHMKTIVHEDDRIQGERKKTLQLFKNCKFIVTILVTGCSKKKRKYGIKNLHYYRHIRFEVPDPFEYLRHFQNKIPESHSSISPGRRSVIWELNVILPHL